jgi:hypothetical protein
MILVHPERGGGECAEARQATSEEIDPAEATARLRTESYLAVVLTSSYWKPSPKRRNCHGHLGTAIPLPVNLAISGRLASGVK